MAEDGDAVWVTAEGLDVVLHPFDGHALVAQTKVLWVVGRAGVAEDVDAEVDGYDDDVLGVGEVLAVVEGSV